MVGDIEAEVQKEVQKYKQELGDRWQSRFFNNFHGNLPGGYRTFYGPDILRRKNYEDDVSEKKRNQTGYEFHDECRTAVIEAGFTLDDLTEVRKRSESGIDRKSFFEMLMPVYVILRKRGYSHYPDLTG